LIHLVRDGRGVANSVMKRTGCSIKKAARSWRNNNIFTLMAQRKIPKGNLLRVRYEDLCRNTIKEMVRICAFAGVNFSDVDFLSNADTLHFIGGSPTAKKGRIEVIELKCDEKWKDELSVEDVRAFDKIAGKMNKLYGYSL
jgi:sulfotransferase family protein